jgi:hypothetical protein
MKRTPLNYLKEGSRVWTFEGFREQGHRKVSVPAATGGTIRRVWKEFSTGDQCLYDVKWDTGQESTYYANQIESIGESRTVDEFYDLVVARADRAKLVLGPQGGFRSFTIYLKDDEWVAGFGKLKPMLEAAGIPIEEERLPRSSPVVHKWPRDDDKKKKKRN